MQRLNSASILFTFCIGSDWNWWRYEHHKNLLNVSRNIENPHCTLVFQLFNTSTLIPAGARHLFLISFHPSFFLITLETFGSLTLPCSVMVHYLGCSIMHELLLPIPKRKQNMPILTVLKHAKTVQCTLSVIGRNWCSVYIQHNQVTLLNRIAYLYCV